MAAALARIRKPMGRASDNQRGGGPLLKGENNQMKITDEFIKQLTQQRNLQSCITNTVVLARSIQKLQRNIDEIKLKIGIPRGNDE